MAAGWAPWSVIDWWTTRKPIGGEKLAHARRHGTIFELGEYIQNVYIVSSLILLYAFMHGYRKMIFGFSPRLE